MAESISGLNGNHEIQLRWDSPLATFMAIVTDRQIEAAIEAGETDEEESDPIVLWVGGQPGEIPTIDELKRILAPYAELTDQTIAQLQSEYNQAYAPSPLQQQTRQWIQARNIDRDRQHSL